MIITIIILATLLVIAIGVAYHFRNQQIKEVQINTTRQQENQKIEESIQAHQNQLLEVQKQVESQTQIVKSMEETAERLRKNAEAQADEWYKSKVEALTSDYDDKQSNLEKEYNAKVKEYNAKIQENEEKLKALQSKQLAYIQAQQRQKEIEEKQGYYRLVISESDLNDISMLRELQLRFGKKESIDKLIWEVYYKPAYDALMSRIITKASKICGIYKITDLITGQAYIGQSLDIKERARQHIKASLSYGKATNKLYQAMQNSGQSNFTFEILEEVPRDQLNEREIYWIDFYKTRELGLNGTRGGS